MGAGYTIIPDSFPGQADRRCVLSLHKNTQRWLFGAALAKENECRG
ncbi:hypothetical protein BN137_2677 [Cronobacter condimenti 1330]|uniref:Uncharacterized protein n=1 Tax=Cronobacter condimenti 1330 TaxID=1073999 RepID=K8A1I8_9ENTR|nr:hypothetical protein BN137_2677 [Cronobacter condimenti 1330]